MKKNNLADLARVILNDPKVKVTFGGNDSYFAHDNGGVHINIAKMEATPEGTTLMCGLIFHESGHIDTTGGKSPGMLGDMENLVEDVRIERKIIAERPGTAYDLEAVTDYYVGKGIFEPKSLEDALRGKAMAYGRGRILNQKLIGAMETVADEFIEEAFGTSFLAEIEQILQGYNALQDTDGSRAMAKQLIDLLIQQKQQQNQQQQSGGQGNSPSQQSQSQQQSSGTGQEEDALAQQSQSQNQEDDESADSQSSGETQSGEDREEDSQPKAGGHGDPSQTSTTTGSGAGGRCKIPTPEEIEEMLANSSEYGDIGQLMKDELNDLAYEAHQSGKTRGIPEWPEIGKLTRSYTPLDVSGAMVASSRMRARLGSLLFAAKRLPVSHGTSGRKLNVKRLVRMHTHSDPKIFSKKVEEAAPNSAVTVVFDTSGSMDSGDCWIVCNQAAFALNAALHSLQGVKCSTLEFSGKDRDDGSMADVNYVCGFGEKPKPEAFNIPPFAGTPTDQVLWAARGLLLQRPEPRKIVLVVTDGDPNDRDSCSAATQRLIKDGIEVAAIGIKCSSVARFWPNHRVINHISELPTAMFGMMEELLTRRPGGVS